MRALAGGLAALVWTASGAMAQPVIVDAEAPAPEAFNESYDESSPVSGSPLVGLRLGTPDVASGNVALIAGLAAFDGSLCLRVTSKDGRFHAANAYSLAPAPADALVRVTPLARKFAEALEGYGPTQVAIRAFASETAACMPAKAVNLPVLDGPRSPGSDLVVFANGKSQPAELALLTAAPEPVVEAPCDPAGDGANIAYDLVCRVSLPDDLAGRATLRLRFSDGFGTPDDYTFDLNLPAVAAP